IWEGSPRNKRRKCRRPGVPGAAMLCSMFGKTDWIRSRHHELIGSQSLAKRRQVDGCLRFFEGGWSAGVARRGWGVVRSRWWPKQFRQEGLQGIRPDLVRLEARVK